MGSGAVVAKEFQKSQGIVVPGNIDLNKRPVVKNKDGSISTVRSATFTFDDGRAILIPTVTDEGKVLEPDKALEYWRNKNQHLGIFDNQQAADAYAEKLHESQANLYKGKQ